MTRTSPNTPDTQLPAEIGGSPPLTLLPQPTDKEEKRDPPALPPDIDLSTIQEHAGIKLMKKIPAKFKSLPDKSLFQKPGSSQSVIIFHPSSDPAEVRRAIEEVAQKEFPFNLDYDNFKRGWISRLPGPLNVAMQGSNITKGHISPTLCIIPMAPFFPLRTATYSMFVRLPQFPGPLGNRIFSGAKGALAELRVGIDTLDTFALASGFIQGRADHAQVSLILECSSVSQRNLILAKGVEHCSEGWQRYAVPFFSADQCRPSVDITALNLESVPEELQRRIIYSAAKLSQRETAQNVLIAFVPSLPQDLATRIKCLLMSPSEC